MLGTFLEVSFAAQPLRPAFEFYRALGFQPIEVGDQLEHAYVALFDGAVAIGLHEREQAGPALTFVRPQLRDYVRALRHAGVEIERTHLADDEFNRVEFCDPNGQLVALLEARTFGPAPEWNAQNVRPCGEFLEYSVATDSVERSRRYWETLGVAEVASGATPHAWSRLAGHGCVIGVHEAGFRSGPCFRSGQLEARVSYLRARGVTVRPNAPQAGQGGAGATLHDPNGNPIYLLEEEET